MSFDRVVAVVAAYDAVVTIYQVKAGEHRLIVGDAFGVVTFNDAHDFVREHHWALLYYLIVAYDVDHSRRRYQGYAVERVFVKLAVGNFDDAFFAALFAASIGTRLITRSAIVIMTTTSVEIALILGFTRLLIVYTTILMFLTPPPVTK